MRSINYCRKTLTSLFGLGRRAAVKSSLTIGLLLAGSVAQAKWIPLDKHPLGYFWQGNRVVVEYQFRLEFFEFGPGFKIEADGPTRVRVSAISPEGNEIVDLAKWKPVKVIRFRRRFDTLLRVNGKSSGPYILLCTNAMESRYSAMSDEEEKSIGNGRRVVSWLNPRFDFDDFCGVFSLDGSVAFRFPVEQRVPRPLAYRVLMSPSGRAIVAIGSHHKYQSEGVEVNDVSNFVKAMIWTPEAGVKTVSISPPVATPYEVIRRLKDSE